MSFCFQKFDRENFPEPSILRETSDRVFEEERRFMGEFSAGLQKKGAEHFENGLRNGRMVIHAALLETTQEVTGILLGINPTPQSIEGAYLNWIITHPDFRNQKIASCLLSSFEESLPSDVSSITAETKWESIMYKMLLRRGFEVEKAKKFTVRMRKNR